MYKLHLTEKMHLIDEAINSTLRYDLYFEGLVNVSRDARKPVIGVSDQVPHKPTFTVTEAD